MKNALLLRDTYDAFSMCDGERIVRNAKFEFLCADVRKHTKYKFLLWRFVAYIIALLSPKQAYEYILNCASSTTWGGGGIGKNIPNDNLVELMVQLVKKKLRVQGSNFTYASAVKAALSSQVQDEIKIITYKNSSRNQRENVELKQTCNRTLKLYGKRTNEGEYLFVHFWWRI